MKKTILKYASLLLIITTITLVVITLINYYGYTNILSEIQSGELTILEKFELQESKDAYLYKTLRILPWTCIISALCAVVSTISIFTHSKAKKNYNKIR